ncbi:MAG: hypothetical protein QM808_05010 [Steroidobacteraceae bacterium]
MNSSKLKLSLLVCLALASISQTQIAAAQMAAAAPQSGVFSDDVNAALESLTTQLNLSAEQKQQARIILEERQVQILAVRKEFPAPKPGADPAPGGPAKMKQVMQGAHARMLKILNPEQQKKYDEIDTTGRATEPK